MGRQAPPSRELVPLGSLAFLMVTDGSAIDSRVTLLSMVQQINVAFALHKTVLLCFSSRKLSLIVSRSQTLRLVRLPEAGTPNKCLRWQFVGGFPRGKYMQ